MRVLFLLIVAANLAAYALGQGWLSDIAPADRGRDPNGMAAQRHPDFIAPQANTTSTPTATVQSLNPSGH